VKSSRLRASYRGMALFGTASMALATVILLVLPIGWFRVLALPFVATLLATLRFQFIEVTLVDGTVKVKGLLRTTRLSVEELDGWGIGPERASLMLSVCAGHPRYVEPVFLVPRSGEPVHVQVLDIDSRTGGVVVVSPRVSEAGRTLGDEALFRGNAARSYLRSSCD
jgi:hypothetical protein